MSAQNKEIVMHFYEELFDHGNLDVIDKFIGDEYIQHNPHAPNGTGALRDFVTGFKKRFPDLKHTVVHALAEGDLVLLYSKAVLEPGSVQGVVDIFRLRDGKIVEHWDVMQDMPETTVGGNQVFATLSSPAGPLPDPDVDPASSKRVATALLDGVIGDRDETAWDRYVAGPYYEHNPQRPNGTTASKEMFRSAFAANPQMGVSVKRVIADGDLVAFHHHLTLAPGDLGFAVIEIFRVRDGKVVEHWDISQPIPATSGNDNTMF